MREYLMLRLDAPQMSFGAAHGNMLADGQDVVPATAGVPPGAGLFPGRPMLTGLLGNALGYDRAEGAALQALSERLRFAAAVLRLGQLHADFQTSKLGADDRGWTTRGRVEARRGGPATYEGSQMRRPLSWVDADVLIALRLAEADRAEMRALSAAIDRPERPLFLGRKTYLPAAPIGRGLETADTAHDAILIRMAAPALERRGAPVIPAPWGMVWDLGEGPDDAPRIDRDDRGWAAGVYQGQYPMRFDVPAPYGEEHV